jgi:hypothetical protein
MRALVLALGMIVPCAGMAETILAISHVTSVTIYPQGAQVVREVEFDAPSGTHEILVDDLPYETEPGLVRIASPDVALGAFALRQDGLPPRAEMPEAEGVAVARLALRAAEGYAQL